MLPESRPMDQSRQTAVETEHCTLHRISMLPALSEGPYAEWRAGSPGHFRQGAADYLSYLSFRASMQQLLPRIHSPKVSDRWSHIEEQAFEHGQAYDSYFATEEGWKRFRARGLDGLISYRRMGKYVKAIGGLLASDDEKPRLLREYTRLSDSFGLLTSFYNVVEEDVELFREHGYQITKWGEEPFVDLQECTWSGKPYEWVRRQTNYCRRAGITIVEHRREEMDAESWHGLLHQLRDVGIPLVSLRLLPPDAPDLFPENQPDQKEEP